MPGPSDHPMPPVIPSKHFCSVQSKKTLTITTCWWTIPHQQCLIAACCSHAICASANWSCRPLATMMNDCCHVSWTGHVWKAMNPFEKHKRPRLPVDVAMQERLSMQFAPSYSSSFSRCSQPISDVGAHPPGTKWSRTPCKESFGAAKHAFCMTFLCCPWNGCPWEIQSYPNHAKLDTVFSAKIIESDILWHQIIQEWRQESFQIYIYIINYIYIYI